MKSLDTEDYNVAKRRAAALLPQWLAEIERALRSGTDHVALDAEWWRRTVQAASPEQREVILDVLDAELDEKVHRAAERAGIVDPSDPRFEDLQEREDAARFYAIAAGRLVRLDAHLEEYLGTLKNEPKTVDMKRSTIKAFCERFPYLGDIQRKEIQRWVNESSQAGKASATIRRSLSELRGYWRYLGSVEVVSEDHLPFEKLSIPKASKNGNGDRRKPFEPESVVSLRQAAQAKGDQHLVDLISLGMWSGARIEELCALKITNVGKGFFTIVDAKTSAGVRTIPVHPKLRPTVHRLVQESTDGYVLSGLTPNKYGDRSNAIGKRFGRLKDAAGFGSEFVFHSIRKTVSTLLDNAGVPENVAADILGHDKPTMTYGLYSGGSSLEVKRLALEKIDYPST